MYKYEFKFTKDECESKINAAKNCIKNAPVMNMKPEEAVKLLDSIEQYAKVFGFSVTEALAIYAHNQRRKI